MVNWIVLFGHREQAFSSLGRPVIGYPDLDGLTSMDRVFRETLRMNAPVGMLARQAIKDTEIVGHYISAGTRLMLGIYPTQRMEPWWNNPDTFDPERFSPERREDSSHRFAWAPFGGSVHKCIGMHFGGIAVKAILHQFPAQVPLEHAGRLRADHRLRHRAVPR